MNSPTHPIQRSCKAIAAAFALVLTSLSFAQLVTLPQASPAAKVHQTVGITDISVSYSRPSVNGRGIWGELVPYGLANLGWAGADAAPWRAGANENTVISFEHDVTVEGKPLSAGSYGFHLIVEQNDDVTAIFSQNFESWGSYFYDPSEDVLRVQVKAEDAPHQEQLAYEFSNITKNGATLSLHWEKKRIPLKIGVDTDHVVVTSLKKEMRSAKSFRYQNLMDAASYLLSNEIELEQALEWADIAINRPWVGRKTEETLELKAKILEKLGRVEEAAAVRSEIEQL